jgi:hypothetical protein
VVAVGDVNGDVSVYDCAEPDLPATSTFSVSAGGGVHALYSWAGGVLAIARNGTVNWLTTDTHGPDSIIVNIVESPFSFGREVGCGCCLLLLDGEVFMLGGQSGLVRLVRSDADWRVEL